VVSETASEFDISYKCLNDSMSIHVKTNQSIVEDTAFVLPIASPSGEKVNLVGDNEITIQKAEGLVSIKANVPLSIKEKAGSRTFNMGLVLKRFQLKHFLVQIIKK